jgi:hypothetical protein
MNIKLKDLYHLYVKYFLYLLWNVCPMNFHVYRHENLTLQNVKTTSYSEIVVTWMFFFLRHRHREMVVWIDSQKISKKQTVTGLLKCIRTFIQYLYQTQ